MTSVPAQAPEWQATVAPRRFYPQLEGMRALAAIGVLTTHVAFQTRAVEIPVWGQILGRLDLAVALFFGLSGFLLWRPWVDAAYGPQGGVRPSIGRYLRHRVVRIWPAYVVVVVVVLTLLPQAQGASLDVWLANLTLTQVFVPLSLTAGLTQMWSLSVEVSFYLLLPFVGLAMMRLRGSRARWRLPVIFGAGALSLGWAWVAMALPLADGIEAKNWVFGHLPWFLGGLILAEAIGAGAIGGDRIRNEGTRLSRAIVDLGSRRWLMFAVFVIAYGLACTPLAGPTGLGDLSNVQFATKMVLGGLVGFALLAPLICVDAPDPNDPDPAKPDRWMRFLTSPAMQALGRWSYAIFIWHLVILAVVFPLFGINLFSGYTLIVWVITLGLTIGISAASYALVEEPARQWLRGWEQRRAQRR